MTTTHKTLACLLLCCSALSGCNMANVQPGSADGYESGWATSNWGAEGESSADTAASAEQAQDEAGEVDDTGPSYGMGESGSDLWDRMRRGYALSGAQTPAMASQVSWLRRNGRYVSRVSEHARPYLYHIVEEVQERGMPTEIALLPAIESSYQPQVVSPSRASGLWQLIPSTGDRLGLKRNGWYDGRRDVTASTQAALDYLETLRDRFDGNWLHAIAAYNCGERTVERAIQRNLAQGKSTDFWNLDLPRETRTFVPRLLAMARILEDPQAHGVSVSPVPDQPYFKTVEVDGQVDLGVVAALADMPLEEVCRLNPGYLKRSTAPTGTHVLLLPVRKADRVANRLAALSRDPSRPTDPGEAGEQIAERQEAPGGGVAAVVAEHSAGENGQALAKTGKGRAGGKAGALSLADTAPAARAGAGKTAKVAQRSGKSGERRIVYVVRKGDTLWAIARKHEVRVADLVRWNGINPKKDLSPGQRLSILREHSSEVARAERSRLLRYTVRNGDTLASLSSRFRVSQTQLRAWNSLQPQADIVPGQRLALFLEPAARQS